MMIIQNYSFVFLSGHYTIKFTERIGNLIQKDLWHIKLYMKTGISNLHIWSMDPSKLKHLLFISVRYTITVLQTPKLFFTQIFRRNRAICKTCFSASQNVKNEFQVKHKRLVRYWYFLQLRSSSMKDYTCH